MARPRWLERDVALPLLRRMLPVFLAGLAAMWALAVIWRQTEKAAGYDFYIYFVNAQLASRDDIDNIYSPETQERVGEEYFERGQRSGSPLRQYDSSRRRRLDSVSSPFLYMALQWVSRDYDFALRQFHVFVSVSFVAGFVLIARRIPLSWTTTLLLLAVLLLWYGGFEADIRVGNVNSLQLLLIGVALWCPPFLAGAVVGILVALKPNLVLVPALLIVARLAARDFRRVSLEILGGFMGIVGAVVATAINYGSFRVWTQWLPAASEFWQRLQTRAERNVAPALEFFRQYGLVWSYVFTAVLFAIAAWVIWRRKGAGDALVIGMATMIHLLSAPVVWLHYTVLVLPLALALMRWRRTAVVSVIALAMIAEEPFQMLFRVPVFPNDAMHITPALVALYVCGIWALAQSEPASTRTRQAEPEDQGGETLLPSTAGGSVNEP